MSNFERNCLLLVNPISGGGKALSQYQGIADQLSSNGYRVRTHISVDETDLMKQVQMATESIIFLLAGDGSLRVTAEMIVKNKLEVLLAPLPAGRGNDFCAVIGIPKDPIAAVNKVIRNPIELSVDVISVNNEKIGLGAISIGIDAKAAGIAFEIQQQGNTWLRGAPLYVVSALKALRSWRSIPISVSIDQQPIREQNIWLFVVSNSGQFGGGMKISPTSNLDDGKLEIISVGEVTKFDFIRTLPKVFFGKHLNHPKLESSSATEVVVNSTQPILAFADGEPIGYSPLVITVMPAALKILK